MGRRMDSYFSFINQTKGGKPGMLPSGWSAVSMIGQVCPTWAPVRPDVATGRPP